MYGRRGTFKINKLKVENDSQDQSLEQIDLKQSEKDTQELDRPNDLTYFQSFIIHPDTKWKSIFDVWILMLVGYSCITNIYFTAFSVDKTLEDEIIFWIVEIFFYFDFIFSWFQGFRDIETNECVWDYKIIAINYFQGWFIIDFISIFPF